MDFAVGTCKNKCAIGNLVESTRYAAGAGFYPARARHAIKITQRAATAHNVLKGRTPLSARWAMTNLSRRFVKTDVPRAGRSGHRPLQTFYGFDGGAFVFVGAYRRADRVASPCARRLEGPLIIHLHQAQTLGRDCVARACAVSYLQYLWHFLCRALAVADLQQCAD